MPLYEFEGKRPWVDSEAFVHPLAVLIGDVTIEAGCYIGAGQEVSACLCTNLKEKGLG